MLWKVDGSSVTDGVCVAAARRVSSVRATSGLDQSTFRIKSQVFDTGDRSLSQAVLLTVTAVKVWCG